MSGGNQNYIDLNAYYLVWPGDITVTGDDDINESIRNILSIYPGSLIFNRSFGSALIKLVHEQMSTATATLIQMYAITVIDLYEPRVTTIPALCSVTPYYDLNQYSVSLGYVIKQTQVVQTTGFILQAQK